VASNVEVDQRSGREDYCSDKVDLHWPMDNDGLDLLRSDMAVWMNCDWCC
jgi:hypothetical protein